MGGIIIVSGAIWKHYTMSCSRLCMTHFPPGQDLVLKCRLAVVWIFPNAKTAVKLVLLGVFIFFFIFFFSSATASSAINRMSLLRREHQAKHHAAWGSNCNTCCWFIVSKFFCGRSPYSVPAIKLRWFQEELWQLATSECLPLSI